MRSIASRRVHPGALRVHVRRDEPGGSLLQNKSIFRRTIVHSINRREFVQDSATLAAGLAATQFVASKANAAPNGSTAFASDWQNSHDRVWLGRDYWANPLQDWRIANGRIECVNPAPDRNVHLLTRSLSDRIAGFSMSVRIGRVGGGPLFGKEGASSKGSFGFRVGVRRPAR